LADLGGTDQIVPGALNRPFATTKEMFFCVCARTVLGAGSDPAVSAEIRVIRVST
jgi:hypothetical protein